jgi:site-specific DNA-methyltransferase (adenine-specific)
MMTDHLGQSGASRYVVRCTAGHERPFIDDDDAKGTCHAPGWAAGWCGCRERAVELNPSGAKPYYEHAGVTIYHGDCRDVLPYLEADALVTDPPYGVELGVGKDMRGGSPRLRHGLAKAAYAGFGDTYEELLSTVVPAVELALAIVKRGALFSGPHLQDFPKATAIGGVYCPVGAGRHQWGFKTFLPVLFYGVDPRLHKGAQPNTIKSTRKAEPNEHPCPKPIEWMRWLIDRVALSGEIVLDPFAGSGTTLRAAKDLGYRAIGIEIEERYCEIAAKRLAQEVLDFGEAA